VLFGAVGWGLVGLGEGGGEGHLEACPLVVLVASDRWHFEGKCLA
jgi:hypothetical protein